MRECDQPRPQGLSSSRPRGTRERGGKIVDPGIDNQSGTCYEIKATLKLHDEIHRGLKSQTSADVRLMNR